MINLLHQQQKIFTCVYESLFLYNVPSITMRVCSFFSAGVGRSGTFIVIDHCLENFLQQGEKLSVDVFHIVQEMRERRVNMIQTIVSDHSSDQVRTSQSIIIVTINTVMVENLLLYITYKYFLKNI